MHSRKVIFVWLAAAALLSAPGCRRQPDSSAGLRVADQGRADRLIARLKAEQIVAGPVGGQVPLYPGEFDRHLCPAIDELVAMADAAVAPLARALNDRDPVVRRNAAFALARLGRTDAAEALYAAAEDQALPPLVRARAVDLLATLAKQHPDKVEIDFDRLATAFRSRDGAADSSRHLRTAVLRAAALSAAPEARTMVSANLDSRDPALRHAAIVATGTLRPPEPPQAVIAALDDPNPRLVLAAAEALGAWQPETLSGHLERLLRNTSPRVRIEAARLIARTAPPGGSTLLLAALGDADISVQREAVAALEALGNARLLEEGLKSPRWRIRVATIEALARMQSAASLPTMAALESDQSFNVRAALATAVGDIGHPAGAGLLVDLLGDPASTVRTAARDALRTLSGDALEDFNPALPAWKNAEAVERARGWADREAARHPPPKHHLGGAADPDSAERRREDINTLIDALALPDGEARRLAIAELVRQKRTAVPALEAALDARPPEVAATILDEVLLLVDPLYMDLKNLAHSDAARRRQAAIGFAGRARGRDLPQVVRARVRAALARESDPLVRRLLTDWLIEAGDTDVADALIESLKSDDARTRQTSALHLGRLQTRKAVPDLIKALDDQRTQVQYAAAWALGRIGDPSVAPALRRCLLTRSLDGRLAFGAALARLGDAGGRDELIRLISEGTTAVQVEAVQAMGEAPHQSYVPTLIETLDDRNARLAAAITRALRTLTGQDFGYRPQARAEVRRKAVADWKAWFAANRQVRPLGEK